MSGFPVTDSHAHVIVPELLAGPGGDEGWRPTVRRDGEGAQVVSMDGREIRSAVNEFVDIDVILDVERSVGIDRVVLCPWVPLLYQGVEPETCRERCRIQNDGLERIVASRQGTVAALGAVPMQDPEMGARELVELRSRGVLAGAEITASVAGVYLGDSRFEPFWEAAEATDSLIFIHPTTRRFTEPVMAEHYLWNTIGNPLETTIAAAHMTIAGVMERHPGLRVLLAHGGGAILALRGRLAHSHGFQPEARSRLSESPLDSVRRFHFDTITHDPELLRNLIEVGRRRPRSARVRLPVRHGRPCPGGRGRSAGARTASRGRDPRRQRLASPGRSPDATDKTALDCGFQGADRSEPDSC